MKTETTKTETKAKRNRKTLEKLTEAGYEVIVAPGALDEEAPAADAVLVAEAVEALPKKSTRLVDIAHCIKSSGGMVCVRGDDLAERIGQTFAVSRSVGADGKLTLTLTEQ